MGSFNKEIYMRGCHLGVRLLDDPSNVYVFVFNSETKEFSDIYPYEEGLEFELENDGLYQIVIFKNSAAELSDEGMTISSRTYSTQELLESIESGWIGVSDITPDIDEMLCICSLKKCLAKLELQVFQEMLKNCGSINCKDSEIKSQRDFLFIAVWLIEHYLELGNIEKARAIYESIRSCGSICGNLLKNKNNCGCNG